MLTKTKKADLTPVARFEHEINRKIKHLLRVMATVEIVKDEGDKAIVASAIREGKQLLKQVSAAGLPATRKAITTPRISLVILISTLPETGSFSSFRLLNLPSHVVLPTVPHQQ